MTIHIFLPGPPPTVTQQEHGLAVNKRGKPFVYDTHEIKAARAYFRESLAPHAPDEPLGSAHGVRLLVKWCWPAGDNHRDGEYKLTKPDTDNLQKLLKDELTRLNFWKDDALVASEIVEKFWAKKSGIFIQIEELGA